MKSVSKPSNLMSREAVASVLADMHLADAGLQLRSMSQDSIKQSLAGYDEFIFEKHGVSKPEFEASFDYYLSIPMQMDTVLTLVVDELNNKDAFSRGVLVAPAK
ncbi:MAG: DUF4296 domain-containing protein [Bacteroidia bacterium]|nr:DUF4296 domain-containing protein [Bacteroidia bacterium]